MIVCGNCGHQNEATDAFCGNCGQFLEWVGQKVETPQPDVPPVAEEAAPSESTAGLVDRLRHAVGLEAAVTDAEPAAATSEPEPAPQPTAEIAPIRSPRVAAPPEPAPEPAVQPVVEIPPESERGVELEPDPLDAAAPVSSPEASKAAPGPEPGPVGRPEAAPEPEARAAVGAAPVVEVPPPAPKPRRGGPSRRAAVPIDPAAASDVVVDDTRMLAGRAPEATPIAAPAPVQPVARQPTVRPPVAPGATAAATPATQPASVEPAPVQPAPVQPGQPASRLPTAEVAIPRPRPSVETPTKVAQPGDLICGTCGEPNDPTRRFCRRCGTGLTMAVLTTTAPWWRRIFRRTARQYEAGERKRTMRLGVAPKRGLGTRFRFVIRWALAGLVLLGVAGYLAVPSMGSLVNGGIRGVVDQVRRIVSPSLTLVHAATTQSNTAVTGHPAENVTDGATNIDWQGDGDELVLTFRFERPIDLGAMNIWNGAADSATKALRTDLRRPAQLLLETQSGQTATIDLDDIHEKQVRYVDLSAVETLEIRVVQTYGPADAPLALSELEFLKKG